MGVAGGLLAAAMLRKSGTRKVATTNAKRPTVHQSSAVARCGEREEPR
jgi:hypothetical protein